MPSSAEPGAEQGTFDLLVCGNIVVDDIWDVAAYPTEDEKIRATSRRSELGGNGCNAARVATSLQARLHVALAAAGADQDDPQTQSAVRILEESGVNTELCVPVPVVDGYCGRATLPSSVIIATATSRTIVNHRCTRELAYVYLKDTPRWRHIVEHGVHWAHFEGRGTEEMSLMMRELRTARQRRAEASPTSWSGHAASQGTDTRRPIISLELERDRPGSGPIHALLQYADVAIVSKDYFKSHCGGAVEAAGSVGGPQHPGAEAGGDTTAGDGTAGSAGGSVAWSSLIDDELVSMYARWRASILAAHPQAAYPPLVIVPLGEGGSAAFLSHQDGNSTLLRMPVHRPGSFQHGDASGRDASGNTQPEPVGQAKPVVDTRGAGDTFIGALISWGATHDMPALQEAVAAGHWPNSLPASHECLAELRLWLGYATVVAGEKVGQVGLHLRSGPARVAIDAWVAASTADYRR